jgi:hypothetical protein
VTLSRRFAPLLIALLLVTAAFVVRSRGSGFQADPCRDPEAVTRVDFVTDPGLVRQGVRRLTSRRTQWTAAPTGTGGLNDPKLATRIVRDFEVFSLWLHPTLVIHENYVPDMAHLEWLDTDAGKLPVHLEYKYSGSRARLVAYAYVYGLEPVASPARAAAIGSWRAVLSGTPPLTIFMASGYIEHGKAPVLRAAALRWTRAAFEHFEAACRP